MRRTREGYMATVEMGGCSKIEGLREQKRQWDEDEVDGQLSKNVVLSGSGVLGKARRSVALA
jgi:hypothetical protein